MALIKKMKNIDCFTEREQAICNYILENPEKITHMSSRELGIKTYSSASAIVRFCKKLGCKGYPDFKIAFLSDLKLTNMEESDENIKISQKDNILSIVNKIDKLLNKSIIQVKKEFSLEQLVRIGKMLNEAEYIDFYVYDINVHIAEYACSQFFYCGKIANTYIAGNIQGLMSLSKKENHLAIIISHTGENLKLVEIAKTLENSKTPTIIITINSENTLSKMGDEVLCVQLERELLGLEMILFSSSVKYILDLMFCIMFVEHYEKNIKLDSNYEKISRNKLWTLINDFK